MIQKADCLIIGGTSLEVGSAASLAHSYHGKYLIIINKGKTRMEGQANLVFHDSIGKILEQISLPAFVSGDSEWSAGQPPRKSAKKT